MKRDDDLRIVDAGDGELAFLRLNQAGEEKRDREDNEDVQRRLRADPAKQPPASGGSDAEHAVAGTITKVDTAAKTVAIKTASGTTEVLKYTEKTTVEAGEATAKGARGRRDRR